ncbi:MAG: tetratricopeptide repeat protein [Bacteroidetes bacterium]|nr:tetratricopeptide repeat protein [Bacteroidota bacterium]
MKPYNLYEFLLLILITTCGFAQNNDQIQLANEYYIQGDLTKAKDIYGDLANKTRNIPLIHNNYFNVLINTQDYKLAEKYISKLIRQFPDNIFYKIDKGILFTRMGNLELADKNFKGIIKTVERDQYKLRICAQYWSSNQFPEYALEAYQRGRKALNEPSLYSLEMANIYRVLNNRDQMVVEYLNYVNLNPKNINYVKNILQNLLSEEEDLKTLETILYEKVQKNPDQFVLNELLIWVNLQQKNFYGAFVQARSLDRRLKTEGNKVLDIGVMALQNKDYENAIKIFSYIVKEYPKSFNYVLSKRYLINAKEERIKNTFPVQTSDIQELIIEYNHLVEEVGLNKTTLQALRSKALLHAFYLDEKDKAILILNKIINTPKSGPRLIANTKLDLGDIYLLIGEPWESTLLYSQVEKANKEAPLGYEAKLRNAKLHYYKGDFALAQSHLDILKEATTREISNDAISLSLLIKENTVLDTSDVAMKEYAAVELLLFQNKKNDALKKLDGMLNHYKGHSLTDDIYWMQATIHQEIGNFQTALSILQKIVEDQQQDIRSDDAYFMMGTIYEEHLNLKEKAMEIYQDFLVKYPGSIYTSEARKRFRTLRGDLP